MHGLRQKINLAREVLSTGRDDGLAANLRLYIAELELEIEQIQVEAATPDKPAKDETDEI
jgi:hypothetical protein